MVWGPVWRSLGPLVEVVVDFGVSKRVQLRSTREGVEIFAQAFEVANLVIEPHSVHNDFEFVHRVGSVAVLDAFASEVLCHGLAGIAQLCCAGVARDTAQRLVIKFDGDVVIDIWDDYIHIAALLVDIVPGLRGSVQQPGSQVGDLLVEVLMNECPGSVLFLC